MKAEYKINNKKIELINGNIVKYPADALVCPANPDLEIVAFSGGVQYAFLSEGGEEIFEEASELGRKLRQFPMDTAIPMAVPETSAHLTSSGRLPSKYVIHSVAAGYNVRNDEIYCDDKIISKSTKNVLDLAREKNLKSIGFPALGTGLYRVPLRKAINSMIEEFSKHLNEETSIERIGLVLYGLEDYLIGKEEADKKFS